MGGHRASFDKLITARAWSMEHSISSYKLGDRSKEPVDQNNCFYAFLLDSDYCLLYVR